MIAGSFFNLGAGQQFESIISLSRYVPKITPGADSTVKAVAGRYESQAVTLSVQATLGEAWDNATPRLPPWRERESVLRGTVIGPDGRPGSEYEVGLLRGEKRHQEKCAMDGTFAFLNVLPGVYKLYANPPGNGQPQITIGELQILEGQILVRNLSLERLFSFSGKVARPDGTALEGHTVMATWRSPDGTETFDDFAVTDANGCYTLSAPFREAWYVGATNGQPPLPHRNVVAGRKDVDFSF